MNEVKKLIPKKDIKLRFYVTSERDQLCWKGGGILSSLNYFKSMWILKKVK
jgi:actin-related protein